MKLLFPLLLLVSLSAAQPSLDLDSCLALASRNSPRLRTADNALRSAGLSRAELRTTGLPQFQANVDGIYLPVPPRYGYDPAITDGGEVRAVMSVRQSLYDAGVRGLRADQLDVDRERLSHEQRLAQLDLELEVRQAFYDALRAGEESALARESLDDLGDYLSLVERLFRGGSASATDLLKTEIQVSSARLALARAQESSRAAKISLEEECGLSPDTSLVLRGSLADTSGNAPDTAFGGRDPDFPGLIDMTVASMNVQRSLLDEEIARHERLPDISLFADAGYLSSGDNLRLPPSERVNGLGYEVGIGIQVPILNWGATGLRTEQREVATDDLRNRMEILRRSIASDAAKLRLQLAGARDRLRILDENIGKARDGFVLTKSRFAAGASLALEVLAAQQSLTETRVSRVQTLAEIRVLAARLERLYAH